MDLKLKGKVALVTGAGSQVGFGKAISLLLANEGCDVAVSDINLEDAEKTAEAVRQTGRRSLAVRADIMKQTEVAAMAEKVFAEFGNVDILINNAGAILLKDGVPLEKQDTEAWSRQINLNLFGTMYVTQAVLPRMRERGSGVIVNIGSGSTRQFQMGVSVYAMSKAAIDTFTKQLAMDEAKHGIRVNCVAPGPAPTNFGAVLRADGPPITEEQLNERRARMGAEMPLGRISTTADVAHAAVFLASDVTGHVTGQVFHVSGGSVM